MNVNRTAYARYGAMVLVCAALILPPGCGRKDSRERSQVQEALRDRALEKARTTLQNLRDEGALDEALALAEESLENKDLAAHGDFFFSEKIQILLMLGKSAEAREAVLEAWRKAPEHARAAFGQIRSHLMQTPDLPATHAWCRELLAPQTGLPADLRQETLVWQMAAAVAQGDPDLAREDIDALLNGASLEVAVPALGQELKNAIFEKKFALVTVLSNHIAAKQLDSPLVEGMLAALAVNNCLAAEEWESLPETFDKAIAKIPDAQLLEEVRTLFPALQKQNKPELLERLSKALAFSDCGKNNAINYAARLWVTAGMTINKSTLPERLDALLGANVSPLQLGGLFERYFYEVADQPPIVAALCKVGEKIIGSCSDTNTVNDLKVKVLDGAFITEDYDLAVAMLEKGIPGKDDNWHAMSLPKVKAHRALAKKEPREAVKHFREFMDAWIKSEQQEEFDPTTGIAHSSAWILGRNARRIADILESIPDADAAAKAREEARDYFKEALKKAAEDQEALKKLKSEIKGFMG